MKTPSKNSRFPRTWLRTVACLCATGAATLALVWSPSGARGQDQVEGLLYFAVENRDTQQVVQRGVTGSTGVAFGGLILDPNTRYRGWVVEASTLRIGRIEFTTGRPGTTTALPDTVLQPPSSHDYDQDQLPDIAEFVIGTNPRVRDTDQDGQEDGIEVLSGGNPLDGILKRTGVIATVDTPGEAVDVCAADDLVIVASNDLATSEYGVSVFNVFAALEPRVIARVPTFDPVVRVTCSRSLIAAATGPGGLEIIDISDPPAARRLYRINQFELGGASTAVTSAGGIGYVGVTTGRVLAVDLASGSILSSANLGFAVPVTDLQISGDFLYAVAGTRLFVLDPAPEALEVLADYAGRGTRVSVGGGQAWLSDQFRIQTVDISNPLEPAEIADFPAGVASLLGFARSGSGYAVVAAGPRAVVLDASDPTGSQVLNQFSTAGDSQAVAISNGLAYLADASAGLQVVSFAPIDTGTIAPTISLTANFSLSPPAVEEGQRLRISADVTDDVMVRNVEFFVDGQRVASDGSYPFEINFLAPLRRNQTTIVVQARTTDTRGNAATTPPVVVNLTPDTTPPAIENRTPRDQGVIGSANLVGAFFTEPMERASFGPGSLALFTESVPGSGNYDQAVSGGALEFRENDRGVFLRFANLPEARYEVRLAGTVQDRALTPIAAAESWRFVRYDPGGTDSDTDGVPDFLEEVLGTNPNVANGQIDSDSDGLSNAGEVRLGLDPTNTDTDGDGTLDGLEDSDRDGLTNGREFELGTKLFDSDSDGDGFVDGEEELPDGTVLSDPLDPQSVPLREVSGALSADNQGNFNPGNATGVLSIQNQ